jgi:hypothetical protein
VAIAALGDGQSARLFGDDLAARELVEVLGQLFHVMPVDFGWHRLRRVDRDAEKRLQLRDALDPYIRPRNFLKFRISSPYPCSATFFHPPVIVSPFNLWYFDIQPTFRTREAQLFNKAAVLSPGQQR